MRPVFQKPYAEDADRPTLMPHGLPACLASLLEIGLPDVPDLRCTPKQTFWQRVNLWLLLRKLQMVAFQFHNLPTEEIFGYHIRIGQYPPPTPLTVPPAYALVYKGKRLAHDPNGETREYTLTPVRWLLLPMDPHR